MPVDLCPSFHINMAHVSNYVKMSQREHILALPDSYIGSRDSHSEFRWVYNPDTAKMNWREVSYNPGFFKIFDELVVNALDHVVRTASKPVAEKVTMITVTLTPTHFSIRNNGEGIPIETHPEYKVMVPELIFGHLLTSSNYDAGEEKTVGGKNGYGAKLTNIYSREFIIRTCDGKHEYEQIFRDNLSTIGKPVVKKTTGKKPYTEIRVEPDLARFFPDAETIPIDMMNVLRTRVMDACALAAGNGCKVNLSDGNTPAVQLTVNSFEKFVRLFMEDDGPIFYERCGPRWEIAAILTRSLHADPDVSDTAWKYRHISFVNGIFTRNGGKHVDAVSRAVLTTFCEGPGKKLKITPGQLKDAVTFFVNATIVNPSFDSQTKETLTTPVAKFGSVFNISDAFVSRLAKDGGLLEEAKAVLDARLLREAKKTDGKRVNRITGIPKLEDATLAGKGKESASCTLILTEGDSAASMAIAGLAAVGRERFGVFPLKGKSLNVQNASLDTKNNNKELSAIKKIIGLKDGKRYTDLSDLRYGRVMIMTDQDVDGSHIKGLLINMFHSEWPELLKLGFICCLMTPLMKATKGKKTVCFYSASEYEQWVTATNSEKGWTIKYYKGLGTSVASEAREYFTSMNTVRFTWDELADTSIDLAFNKKRADDRKIWLETYDRHRVLNIPAGGADVSYSTFVNDELIHFSNASNVRSIPHIMDGFKPSQRKILWAARKRNLVSEIKVAQLGGYVSEHAAYHHGETALEETIVGMAHDFVGSNNINILVPSGQFGTRLQGGKDSAASRYIFTSLTPIQSSIFYKSDDTALKWIVDDGLSVEPEYYLPIIPMLLVNGAAGIGTGYSTNVLKYSPHDIISAIRSRLDGSVTNLTETTFVPWWDGFRGSVTMSNPTKIITTGVYQFTTDDTYRVHITELPVGMWTRNYKEFLDDMLVVTADTKGKGGVSAESHSVDSKSEKPRQILISFDNASTETSVDMWITLEQEYFHEARAFPAEFEKRFKLTQSFTTTNMVAFDCDGTIRLFRSVGEIMELFYEVRLEAYSTRKENELIRLNADIVELGARARFVKAVVDGTLVVANAEDEALLEDLKSHELPALSGPDTDLRGYEYLLRMRVDRLKAKAVLELEANCASVIEERDELDAKSAEDMWFADLATFEIAYTNFVSARKLLTATTATDKVVAAPKKIRAKKAAVKKDV